MSRYSEASLDALICALEAPEALVACEPLVIDGGLPLVRVTLAANGLELVLDVEAFAVSEDAPVSVDQPSLHPTSRAALEAIGLLPGGNGNPLAAVEAGNRLEIAVATAHHRAIAAAAPRLVPN